MQYLIVLFVLNVCIKFKETITATKCNSVSFKVTNLITCKSAIYLTKAQRLNGVFYLNIIFPHNITYGAQLRSHRPNVQ